MATGQAIKLNPFIPNPYAGLNWNKITENTIAEADNGYLFSTPALTLELPSEPIDNTLIQFKLADESNGSGVIKTVDNSLIKTPIVSSDTLILDHEHMGGTLVYLDGTWELFNDNSLIKDKSEVDNTSDGDPHVALSEEATKSLFKDVSVSEHEGLNARTIRETTIELDAVRRAKYLPKNTDLDTVTDTGIYRMYNPTNAPDGAGGSGTSKWIYLNVVKHADNYVWQEAYNLTGKTVRKWARLKDYWLSSNHTQVWTEWKSVESNFITSQNVDMDSEGSDDISLSEKAIKKLFSEDVHGSGEYHGLDAHTIRDTTITLRAHQAILYYTNRDINEITNTGVYAVCCTNGVANPHKPSGASTTIYLTVSKFNDNNILQIATNYNSSKKRWYRRKVNGTWEGWSLILSNDTLVKYADVGYFDEGDDDNPITEKGVKKLFVNTYSEKYEDSENEPNNGKYFGLSAKQIRETTIPLLEGRKTISLDRDTDLDDISDTGLYKLNGDANHGKNHVYQYIHQDRYLPPAQSGDTKIVYFRTLMVINDGEYVHQIAADEWTELIFVRRFQVGAASNNRWRIIVGRNNVQDHQSINSFDLAEWMSVNLGTLKATFLNPDEGIIDGWDNLGTGVGQLDPHKFVPTAQTMKDRFIELAKERSTMTLAENYDLNNIVADSIGTGFYFVKDPVHGPEASGYFYIQVLREDTNTVCVDAINAISAQPYRRVRVNGIWQPWHKLPLDQLNIHNSGYAALLTSNGDDSHILTEKAVHSLFYNNENGNGTHYGLSANAIHKLVDSIPVDDNSVKVQAEGGVFGFGIDQIAQESYSAGGDAYYVYHGQPAHIEFVSYNEGGAGYYIICCHHYPKDQYRWVLRFPVPIIHITIGSMQEDFSKNAHEAAATPIESYTLNSNGWLNGATIEDAGMHMSSKLWLITGCSPAWTGLNLTAYTPGNTLGTYMSDSFLNHAINKTGGNNAIYLKQYRSSLYSNGGTISAFNYINGIQYWPLNTTEIGRNNILFTDNIVVSNNSNCSAPYGNDSVAVTSPGTILEGMYTPQFTYDWDAGGEQLLSVSLRKIVNNRASADTVRFNIYAELARDTDESKIRIKYRYDQSQTPVGTLDLNMPEVFLTYNGDTKRYDLSFNTAGLNINNTSDFLNYFYFSRFPHFAITPNYVSAYVNYSWNYSRLNVDSYADGIPGLTTHLGALWWWKDSKLIGITQYGCDIS